MIIMKLSSKLEINIQLMKLEINIQLMHMTVVMVQFQQSKERK